jgi:hypothetical protein
MTLPKKVAKTLTGIMDHPIMKIIMDRSKLINGVLHEVNSWWGYYLYLRKPGPAYIDDRFVGTDLDMSCFLFELVERNAVINIPEYKSIRPRSRTKGFQVISPMNRHGQIIGLTSNKDTFLFSIRLKDMNVISSNTVGAYRNFSLTDLSGNLYIKSFQFIPNQKENKFLTDSYVVDVNNNISFEYFVHPNRWSSMFGQHYIMTKMLIERLKEQCADYQVRIDEMLKKGIRYPKKGGIPFQWPEKTKEIGKKVIVESFQVEMTFPENTGKFQDWKFTQENLVRLTELRNYLLFTFIPKLQFAVRTVEFAYYKYGENRIPHWIKNTKWESNYVPPGRRAKWDRIILFQRKVGEEGISLKKRVYKKSEEVSLDY